LFYFSYIFLILLLVVKKEKFSCSLLLRADGEGVLLFSGDPESLCDVLWGDAAQTNKQTTCGPYILSFYLNKTGTLHFNCFTSNPLQSCEDASPHRDHAVSGSVDLCQPGAQISWIPHLTQRHALHTERERDWECYILVKRRKKLHDLIWTVLYFTDKWNVPTGEAEVNGSAPDGSCTHTHTQYIYISPVYIININK